MARDPLLGGQHGIVNNATADNDPEVGRPLVGGWTDGAEKSRGEVSDGRRGGDRGESKKKRPGFIGTREA